MKLSPLHHLEQIFQTRIQTLALSLRPNTVYHYPSTARCFLAYLRAAFPRVRRLSPLPRDPHLLGCFRSLCEQQPPLCNVTRIHHLIYLRRLLEALAADGHSLQPDLIRREDFPSQPRYLPRPLPLEEDQRLQQELRRTDDLVASALRLAPTTGIRIGECLDLPLDCLRPLGPDPWALHLPLGKLHTERLIPADSELRQIVEPILTLRAWAPSSHLAKSQGLLLPRGGRQALYKTLLQALAPIAQRAGCSTYVTPHRLRHDFATEMLRLGVSLPARMQLLGHKDIPMTLRYAQFTQQDLQPEFHQARRHAASLPLPTLPLAIPDSLRADLPGICQALLATRHLLEMFRRQRSDEKTKRKLERLERRLRAVTSQLKRIETADK